MSEINDFYLLLAVLIYIALGLTVGILLSRRRSKKLGHAPGKNIHETSCDSNGTLTVNGHYELRMPPHKQGGMATIWLASERKTGRECIIKTPRRGTAMDHVYLDKLVQEAKYLKKFQHSAIVMYLDDFHFRDEYHLVLEYLQGETLMASSPRVPYEEQQVVAWAYQLLEALSYIHNSGMVHRDINPKNIMLCSDGTVKLIDFGTAKRINEIDKDKAAHEAFTQITNKGFDIPELFTGEASDQRCDLCGLAQTCIYLLTLGQPNEICSALFKHSWPRTFAEATLLVNHLAEAGVSMRTAKCLAQAVMFSPEHRFADAHAMLAALSTVDGFPIKAAEAMVQA